MDPLHNELSLNVLDTQGCFMIECVSVFDPETSNSSWAEMEPFVIGCYSLKHPLTIGMKARLILQYLATMGDYQEVGLPFFIIDYSYVMFARAHKASAHSFA